MSANEDLQRFVRDGLAHGTSRAELGGVLAKAGWDRPEVSAALACFADLDFPVPVPRPKASLSARDALSLGDYIRKWRKGLTIELREDLRLKGTFKDAVKALLRPARLRHMIPTKPR